MANEKCNPAIEDEMKGDREIFPEQQLQNAAFRQDSENPPRNAALMVDASLTCARG